MEWRHLRFAPSQLREIQRSPVCGTTSAKPVPGNLFPPPLCGILIQKGRTSDSTMAFKFQSGTGAFVLGALVCEGRGERIRLVLMVPMWDGSLPTAK